MERLMLFASVATGLTGVVAQATIPLDGSFALERLGVAAILVVACGIALRYMVAQNEKKDQQFTAALAERDKRVKEIQDAYLASVEKSASAQVASAEKNAALLHQALMETSESNHRVSKALEVNASHFDALRKVLERTGMPS